MIEYTATATIGNRQAVLTITIVYRASDDDMAYEIWNRYATGIRVDLPNATPWDIRVEPSDCEIPL